MNSQINIWLKNKKTVEKTFNNYITNGMLKKEEDLNLTTLHLKRARLDIEFSGYILEEKQENIHWAIVISYCCKNYEG